MKHIGETEIKAGLEREKLPSGVSVFRFDLLPDETAWDPTSTKGRKIIGPAAVTITQYPDAGMEVHVRDTDERFA